MCAVFCVSCSYTSRSDAAEYNDQIVKYQYLVVQSYDKLLVSFENYNPQLMDKALDDLLAQISSSRQAVSNLKDITDGSDLKNAAIEYFDIYEQVINSQAKELIRLYKFPEEEFTPQMRVQWDGIYRSVDQQLKEADKKIMAAQMIFASNYKLTLNKNAELSIQ